MRKIGLVLLGLVALAAAIGIAALSQRERPSRDEAALGTHATAGVPTDSTSSPIVAVREEAPVAPSEPANAAAAATGRPLEVRIVDGDSGEPVPSAELFVLAADALLPGDSWSIQAFDERSRSIAESSGASVAVDGDGRARVQPVGSGTWLLACAGERSARRLVYGRQREPLTLRLLPRTPFRVRVVDADGRPLENIPMRLLEERRQVFCGNETPSVTWRGRTDREGVAEIPHALERIAGSADADGIARTEAMFLAFDFPQTSVARRPIDPRGGAGQPLTMVAPPRGRLRLRAVGPDGAPLDTAVSFSLHPANELPMHGGEPMCYVSPTRDVAVAEVEIGQPIAIQAYTSNADLAGARTLAQADSTDPLDVVLAFARAAPGFSGRVLDVDGRPLARATLHWRLITLPDRPFAQTSFQRTESDADGRFRLAARRAESRPCRLEFVHTAAGDSPETGAAYETSTDVAAGVSACDLGNLRLRARDLVVAGRVVDADGSPLCGVAVFVYTSAQRMASFNTATGVDGRFTIHGECHDPEIHLAVLDDHYFLDPEPPDEVDGRMPRLRVENGRGDVELVLDEKPSLRGSLLLDPEIDPSRLELRTSAETDSTIEGDGSFEIVGVPQTLKLSVRVPDEDEPLVKLDDIELRGPPDSRLHGIDLRGRIRSTRVELVDADGKPSRYGLLGVCDARGVPLSDLVRCDPFGRESILTASREARAFAGAPGHRPVDVPLDGAEHRVTLAPGFLVRLVLTGIDPELLAGATLEPNVELIQGTHSFPPNFLEHLVNWELPESAGPFETQWRLPSPGEYSVQVLVRGHDRSGWIESPKARFTVVHADDEQRVDIPVSKDAVAAALAELEKLRR